METYEIPCSWQMYGSLKIIAEDLDEAIALAESTECNLPTNGSYVDASFEVDHAVLEDERDPAT
jgi:hypothetical protein